MVDGRRSSVMQDVLEVGAAEEARRLTEQAEREARSFAGTFTKETTPNVTGLFDGKTFLFVFVKNGGVEEWQDPRTGIVYAVRPVYNAFYNRRAIQGITHVGYHLAIDNHDLASHNIVAWGPKRDVVRELTGVTGLRVER